MPALVLDPTQLAYPPIIKLEVLKTSKTVSFYLYNYQMNNAMTVAVLMDSRNLHTVDVLASN
jgi:hypothetical protein